MDPGKSVSSYERELREKLSGLSFSGGEFDPSGAVLVTGVSGFLGSHVVSHLTRYEDARRLVLMHRSGSKLPTALRNLISQNRVESLIGDLELPRFGLNESRWNELCGNVAQVVHIGGAVNHVKSLPSLYRVNVEGSLEILRLVCTGSSKRLHFMSSVAACGADRGTIAETHPLPRVHLPGGYAATKWLAETLIDAAQEVGVDALIYRLGAIGPDRTTGAVNPLDYRWLVLSASIAIGQQPAISSSFGWLPVDHVAEAVARIVLSKPDLRVHRLHLEASATCPWETVFQAAQDAGYGLDRVDRETWLQSMREKARLRDDLARRVLSLGLPRQSTAQASLDTRHTFDTLGRFVLSEPSWSADSLPETLAWARGEGLLRT